MILSFYYYCSIGYAADAAKSNSDFDREKYSFPPIGNSLFYLVRIIILLNIVF